VDISNYFEKHLSVIKKVEQDLRNPILACAEIIVASLQSGGKVITLGNGGSAADAQHFATELVGRFHKERKAIPAIALSADSVLITAVGNDYGIEEIFARQVEALAAPGDVVVGISTSGRSANVIKALLTAQQVGCSTLCLTGCDGGRMVDVVDQAVVVPSFDIPHIQEAHITIIHILCAIIESRVACPKGRS